MIHGFTAPGFAEVEAVFRENFEQRDEVGAACSVYHKGECVVDLWGGVSRAQTETPWAEDTLVPVFSTSKGLSAMTIMVAHARGHLDFDERVAAYWPEFAEAGKGEITVRQLLSHQAGLCVVDEPVRSRLSDPQAGRAAAGRARRRRGTLGPAGRGGPLSRQERRACLSRSDRLLREQRVCALLPLLPAQAHGR